MTVAERASTGATFLDKRVPDWYNLVNPATLDIGHGEACVLGQLFGSYWNGVRALDIELDNSGENALPTRVSCGFTLLGFWGADSITDLTNAWREEIAARRLKDYVEQATPELVAVH